MWGKFFAVRSSSAFISRWVAFLEGAGVSTTPLLHQHLTDLVFRAIVTMNSDIQHPGEAAIPAVTQTEGNALRHAAGYVCRHLKVKLEKSNNPLKEDLIQCLKCLTQDTNCGGSESGAAEEWTNLVDRGGLWRVRDTTFQVFCALEEEIRACLYKLVQDSKQTNVEEVTTHQNDSEDVQFTGALLLQHLLLMMRRFIMNCYRR